jgi:signal transduction histidine kinase
MKAAATTLRLRDVALDGVSPHSDCAPNHHVQFYESDDFFSNTAARFLAEGLPRGQALLVVVTEQHRDGITDQLRSIGVNVGDAVHSGQLTFLDARDHLASYMVGSMPDAALVRAVDEPLFARLLASREKAGLRAFGETSDLLCQDGNFAAAMRLESMARGMPHSDTISILCAYSMSSFASEHGGTWFQETCRQHYRVQPAEYQFPVSDDAQSRAIAALQQRVAALSAQLHLAKSQALAAPSSRFDFLSAVTHELLTPLNGIIAYQDLLAREAGGPITTRQRAYLEHIKAATDELVGILDQAFNQSSPMKLRH